MGLSSKITKLKMITKIPRGILSNGIMRINLFYKNSLVGVDEGNIAVICREMRIMAHTIEKGLSLPSVRRGFGKEKIKSLLELMDKYLLLDNFEYDFDSFLGALGIVCKYMEVAERYDCDTSFIKLDKFAKWTDTIELRNYGTASIPKITGGY